MVLLGLKEKGPTVQDRQVLYADVTNKLGQAGSILSDSYSPAVAMALADEFLATVSARAGGARAKRTGTRAAPFHPGTARLPARASNKRRRGAPEQLTRGGSKRAATLAST